MISIKTWLEAILNSFIGLWGSVWGLALPVIGALVILYIGWILGRFLERILTAAGSSMKTNDAEIARSPFGQFLTSLGISFSIAGIFGWIAWAVKWFFYASFFMAAMSVLAFTAVNTFIGSATAFFPKAIAGALFIFATRLLPNFFNSLFFSYGFCAETQPLVKPSGLRRPGGQG